MHYTEIDVHTFRTLLETHATVLFPIGENTFGDRTISAILMYCEGVIYALNINHPDLKLTNSLDDLKFNAKNAYAYKPLALFNPKFDTGNVYDIEALAWILGIDFKLNAKLYDYYSRQNWTDSPATNVPLYSVTSYLFQCVEFIKDITSEFSWEDIDAAKKLYNRTHTTFYRLGYDGIAIADRVQQGATGAATGHSIHPVYYNLFTKTGRPTMQAAGMYLHSLSKHDGSRSQIISRFEGGRLVEFDYKAHFINILGRYVGVNENPADVYEKLAVEFFGKNPNPEQITAAKQKTFQLLWGNEPVENHVILQIRKLRDKLYSEYINQDYVSLNPPFNRKFTQHQYGDIPAGTLLLNMAQFMETCIGARTIQRIQEYLQQENHKSEIALYFFDAIVLDYHPDDDPELIRELSDIISFGGSHPIHIKSGSNYDSMEPVLGE